MNHYYCPTLIDILKPYLATLPLWTGITLKHLGKTRDTNSQVENWFRTTKRIILRNKLHRRPGDFVQIMYKFIYGRMRGVSVSAARQKRVIENETETCNSELPLSQEEKWKKAKYYNPPSNMSGLESIYIAPPWSGKGQIARRTIALSNTCTIDNLLYFIFLAMKNRPSLLSEIENKQALDKCFKALLRVHQNFLL